ncbi:hypothetical protein ES332_A06G082500v1 [Gossypium tomentosum]|uniref:Uncharacterized protein n=1 Tax=Gossypium tomentosum TaxID=34277 RepID=A0A5D2Q3Z2_GOSTO|nr:hypothetical protein ES332_A06G082500v1 [Gossypium tomentosum]
MTLETLPYGPSVTTRSYCTEPRLLASELSRFDGVMGQQDFGVHISFGRFEL